MRPLAGLAVNGVATVDQRRLGAMCCLREARKRRSPALAADGRHLLADVYTSVGVIVGLSLASLTGWAILDPVLAALVAVNILWSGWLLVRESVGGLMDEAVPNDFARPHPRARSRSTRRGRSRRTICAPAPPAGALSSISTSSCRAA